MDLLEPLFPYAAALLPTAGVAFLFYLVVRSMIEADRSERKAIARWQKEHPDDSAADSTGEKGRE